MDIDERLIIYTYHSLDRISLRGITREMIKSALSNPDKTGVGYKIDNSLIKHLRIR
jgi:hypothetical protein